jgi:hypothetical protein
MKGRFYEPEDIPQASLEALNNTIVCDAHSVHPRVCGCEFDQITAEEAARIWNDDVIAELIAEEFDLSSGAC